MAADDTISAMDVIPTSRATKDDADAASVSLIDSEVATTHKKEGLRLAIQFAKDADEELKMAAYKPDNGCYFSNPQHLATGLCPCDITYMSKDAGYTFPILTNNNIDPEKVSIIRTVVECTDIIQYCLYCIRTLRLYAANPHEMAVLRASCCVLRSYFYVVRNDPNVDGVRRCIIRNIVANMQSVCYRDATKSLVAIMSDKVLHPVLATMLICLHDTLAKPRKQECWDIIRNSSFLRFIQPLIAQWDTIKAPSLTDDCIDFVELCHAAKFINFDDDLQLTTITGLQTLFTTSTGDTFYWICSLFTKIWSSSHIIKRWIMSSAPSFDCFYVNLVCARDDEDRERVWDFIHNIMNLAHNDACYTDIGMHRFVDWFFKSGLLCMLMDSAQSLPRKLLYGLFGDITCEATDAQNASLMHTQMHKLLVETLLTYSKPGVDFDDTAANITASLRNMAKHEPFVNILITSYREFIATVAAVLKHAFATIDTNAYTYTQTFCIGTLLVFLKDILLRSQIRIYFYSIVKACVKTHCFDVLKCATRQPVEVNTHAFEILLKYYDDDNNGALLQDPEFSADKLDTCAICLDRFVKHSSSAQRVPCGHRFHKDCITQWLRVKMTVERVCPTCRQRVPTSDDLP